MKCTISFLALILGMFATQAAFATSTSYRSTMSGPNESPPNNSGGVSIAAIVIDNIAMTMSVTVPFIDLVAPSTDAHLHCCTAQPLIGTAPVAIPLVDFPLGVHSGVYEHLFKLADAGTYAPAFITAHGGTVLQARDFLLGAINANESYLNIHSSQYPAGEIRGFLAQPVPEPSAWLMLGVGLAGLGLYARRQRG